MSSIEKNRHVSNRRSLSQPKKYTKNDSPPLSKTKNLFTIIRCKLGNTPKKTDASTAYTISSVTDNESTVHKKYNTLIASAGRRIHSETGLLKSLSNESLNTHNLSQAMSHKLCRHATIIPRRKKFSGVFQNNLSESSQLEGFQLSDKEYCQATARILKINKDLGVDDNDDENKDDVSDQRKDVKAEKLNILKDRLNNAGECSKSNLVNLPIPSQPYYDQLRDASRCSYSWNLTHELFKLSNFGWYWGPLSRTEAEEKLAGQPDGSFLVRDSSNDRYLLSLSFRAHGCTLHTRIEHCNGSFSFYTYPGVECHSSIRSLIESSMCDSQVGPICYSRTRQPGSLAYEVRLSRPVSRFAQIRTLQYWCRFVIRQSTRLDHIRSLPLPYSLKGWLEEGQF